MEASHDIREVPASGTSHVVGRRKHLHLEDQASYMEWARGRHGGGGLHSILPGINISSWTPLAFL